MDLVEREDTSSALEMLGYNSTQKVCVCVCVGGGGMKTDRKKHGLAKHSGSYIQKHDMTSVQGGKILADIKTDSCLIQTHCLQASTTHLYH